MTKPVFVSSCIYKHDTQKLEMFYRNNLSVKVPMLSFVGPTDEFSIPGTGIWIYLPIRMFFYHSKFNIAKVLHVYTKISLINK
jgi:hypothetical protein